MEPCLGQFGFLNELSGLPRVQFRWVFGAANEKYCAIDDFSVEIESIDYPAGEDLRADTLNGVSVTWNPAAGSSPNGYEVSINGQSAQTVAETSFNSVLTAVENEIAVVAAYSGGISDAKSVQVMNLVAMPAENLSVSTKVLVLEL